MPNVNFTVRVTPAAALPKVSVEVGLDLDANGKVGAGEVQIALRQPNGDYAATFQVPTTTGRFFAVRIVAAAGSPFTVDVDDGANALLTTQAQGQVLANRRGMAIGKLL